MPSPFPGMDPYLEAPDIWPDLHEALAGEMRAELNLLLPQPYYARLEVRPEVGIVDDEGTSRRIVPDATVIRKASDTTAAPATVTLSERRATISASVEVTIASEPLRHQVVEIRDASRGHKLITLIEIVSPSNKRAGVVRSVSYPGPYNACGCSHGGTRYLKTSRRLPTRSGRPAALAGVHGRHGMAEPVPLVGSSCGRGWRTRAW